MIVDVFILGALLGLMAFSVLKISRDLFDPVLLFTLLYFPKFILRPAFLLFDFDLPYTRLFAIGEYKPYVREVAFIQLLAYASFVVGYAYRSRLSDYLQGKLPSFRRSRINLRRLEFVAIASTAASGLMLLFYLVQYSSLTRFMLAAREGLMGTLPKTTLLVTSFVTALYLVTCLTRQTHRRRAWILYLASLAMLFLINDRSSMVYAGFAALIGYHYSVRRLSLKKLAATAMVLLTVLNIMTFVRGFITQQAGGSVSQVVEEWQSDTDTPGRNRARELSDAFNGATVDYFAVIVRDFEFAAEYHLGHDFYIGLVGIVPRSMWSNKPENITVGSWFTSHYMPSTSQGGRPISAVGEWYLNFGYLGVVLGLFLCGFLMRVIYDNIRRSGNDPRMIVLYVIIFFYMTGWGVIGNTIFQKFVFWIVPFTLLYMFIRDRRSSGLAASAEGALPRL